MEFEYFKDPLNFAFLMNDTQPCSICKSEGLWFDAGGYIGAQQIDCICVNCLKSGSLIELEIEANSLYNDGSEEAITLIYKTPALPSWQDIAWPVVDGKYPVFERIASKQDFENIEYFLSSYVGKSHDGSDLGWLWGALPEKPLTNFKAAGGVSVYLFTSADKKFWIWDAN